MAGRQAAGRHGVARAAAVAVVLLLAAALASPASAAAAHGPYSRLGRPGPALTVARAKLRASLACTPGVRHATRNPILLVPGTNLDPGPNFAWNYERALRALGRPFCTVTLPHHAMGDIQVAGEYVVHALRSVASRAHRRIEVLGYSQGGMLPRWALRFWPRTRSLVTDVVGLDPSNHGTLDAQAACHSSCPPAYWQQSSGAHFLAALNSRAETFAGIDYTVVFSHADEVVVPNLDASGSSSLHTGGGRIENVAVQQVCPGDASDHLAMGTYDAVGYALALDAFDHRGPANPARISAATCARPFQPGVDPATFATDYAGFVSTIATAAAESPEVSAEPPLRCYVLASCRRGQGED